MDNKTKFWKLILKLHQQPSFFYEILTKISIQNNNNDKFEIFFFPAIS